MGLLLTNAWRIESSSVRLYPSLRSWSFFWCVFHKRKPRGGNFEDSFSPFTSRAFSSAPAWGCLEHTLGRKTTKKPPATQAIFTLTAEHRHTAIWCQYGYFGWFQQKKPYSLLWESPIALLCSHIAVTNRHISWLFHQVWKRLLKPTEKGNCEANKKCLSNVVSFAPKMASSCFKILSSRYLKIPAIKFDPYLLNTATQPLNTPTSLWPRCVSVCLWRTDFLSLSLRLDFLF